MPFYELFVEFFLISFSALVFVFTVRLILRLINLKKNIKLVSINAYNLNEKLSNFQNKSSKSNQIIKNSYLGYRSFQNKKFLFNKVINIFK